MAIPRALLGLLLLPPGIVAVVEAVQSRSAAPPPPPATQGATSAPPVQGASKDRVSSPVLVEGDTVRLVIPRDSSAATLKLVQLVENKHEGPSYVDCIRAVLRDSGATAHVVNGTFNGRSCAPNDTLKVILPKWSLTAITVSFAAPTGAPPYVGQLAVATRDSISGKSYLVQRPLKLSYAPTVRGSPYAERFVLWTLVVSVVFAFGTALFAKKGTPPSGDPSWDPKTSWASNVGVAGGLMTALLAVVLPDPPRYLAKPAYALLGAIFVAITALAPSAYAFVARISSKVNVRAAAVAAASAVTLWGALGQLATAWALFGELVPARVLPPTPAKTFQGLMIVLGVLLLIYAVSSIRAMLNPPPADAAAAVEPSYKLL